MSGTKELKQMNTIISNDGWQEIKFIEIDTLSKNAHSFLLFEIILKADFWKKDEAMDGFFNEVVTDKKITFTQICIDELIWKKFIDFIKKWRDDGLLFDLEFYNEFGQLLNIKINATYNGLISSKEKPVLTLLLNDSRTKFQFDMIVDRTSFDSFIAL
ncbi:MAG: hypothetical protein IPL23_09980 [Saprospiraceae bacterium]|nr:hypothetical protein [Saprospiraceae bacterium]HMS70847.1 hypothetical protein [Saprospiraceae bacterium]